MLHLHDGMLSIGACLGCFVTERKHREVKGAACHIFRNFEHTVLVDLVNRQAEDFRCGIGFEGLDLVKPNPITVNDKTFLFSRKCMLLCGETCKDDVVALSGKRLRRVLGFWAEQQPSPEGLMASPTISQARPPASRSSIASPTISQHYRSSTPWTRSRSTPARTIAGSS
jgi:hypothetical protein